MMRTTIKTTGLSILLIIAINMMLNAQYGRGFDYFGRYNLSPDLPDLTDKQKTEIRSLTVKHWEQMDALTKEIRESDNPEEENAAIIKLQNLRLTYRSDVMKLLTDEQKTSLMLNSNLYGAGMGRGMGPCGAGYGPGRGRFWGMNQGLGYGFGRRPGWGMGRASGYGIRRVW